MLQEKVKTGGVKECDDDDEWRTGAVDKLRWNEKWMLKQVSSSEYVWP